MPNINNYFPSKFLKAADLNGAEPVVTIERVEFEPVGRDREMKAVLYFAGKTKGLVLNVTNGRKITELTGSAITEEWTGHKIKLYATETTFGGEQVDCIRIKTSRARQNVAHDSDSATTLARHQRRGRHHSVLVVTCHTSFAIARPADRISA